MSESRSKTIASLSRLGSTALLSIVFCVFIYFDYKKDSELKETMDKMDETINEFRAEFKRVADTYTGAPK